MCLKHLLKDKEDANDHDGAEDIWCKTTVAGAKVFKIDLTPSGYEILSRTPSKRHERNSNVRRIFSLQGSSRLPKMDGIFTINGVELGFNLCRICKSFRL